MQQLKIKNMKTIILLLIQFLFLITSSKFVLSSPVLVEPPIQENVLTLEPMLDWTDENGAVEYHLQIVTDPYDFGMLTSWTTVTSSTYDIPAGMLQPNTTYYWRVRSAFSSGFSDWTEPWNFTTPGSPSEEINEVKEDVTDLVNSSQLAQSQGNSINNRLTNASNQLSNGHPIIARLLLALTKLHVGVLVFSSQLSVENGETLTDGIDYVMDLIEVGNSPEPELTIKADKFSLEQNYPNPFNPETSIEYTIPFNLHVQIKVFDIQGKEVATLVDKLHQPGRYITIWNASNFSSGTYFYRIQADDFVKTKRMTLVK